MNGQKNWKTEIGITLAKNSAPKSEADVRSVSLTVWYSKFFEEIVVEWLLGYIEDQIDPRQFGAKIGVSTTHYLIEFISFILYNWDLSTSHAVMATLLDFQKAFNKVNHNFLVTCQYQISFSKLSLVF